VDSPQSLAKQRSTLKSLQDCVPEEVPRWPGRNRSIDGKGGTMPTKAILLKMTPEGMKDLKGGRQRFEESRRQLEAAGGKILSAWAVQGPYDFLVLVDLPDDRAGFALNAAASRRGTATTETWSILPIDEFYTLVEKV
jgi:uncharacterized protein with GYD domain